MNYLGTFLAVSGVRLSEGGLSVDVSVVASVSVVFGLSVEVVVSVVVVASVESVVAAGMVREGGVSLFRVFCEVSSAVSAVGLPLKNSP